MATVMAILSEGGVIVESNPKKEGYGNYSTIYTLYSILIVESNPKKEGYGNTIPVLLMISGRLCRK